MKCPKCGYLGFEQLDRCRNCGYEFALAGKSVAPELPLQGDRLEGLGQVEEIAIRKQPGAEKRASTPDDFPLFESVTVDEEPLITKASPPRVPLAVRRTTPDVPRVSADARAQSFELGFETDPSPRSWFARASQSDEARFRPSVHEGAADAGLGSRFLAAALDLVILGAVDALVVYFTMQICGLTVADFDVLPKAPLLAFLLVQNGGYLVAFTAGGQTLGKMAAGIRVVSANQSAPLDLGRATKRTLLWAVLAIPAGLGFLTAFLSRDHRGLHDRFAGTRVIRASA